MKRSHLLAGCALLLVACAPKIPTSEIAGKLKITLKPLPDALPGASAPGAFAAGLRLSRVWIETPAGGETELRYSALEQNKWTAPVAIVRGELSTANGHSPSISELGDGSLVATWFEPTGPRSSRSTDLGLTWSAAQNLSRTIGDGA